MWFPLRGGRSTRLPWNSEVLCISHRSSRNSKQALVNLAFCLKLAPPDCRRALGDMEILQGKERLECVVSSCMMHDSCSEETGVKLALFRSVTCLVWFSSQIRSLV